MLSKIVSGGQTGADRAALDAALEAGFDAGGFCPRGRKAEDGEIDFRYPLIEIDGGYRQRTLKNVLESDATVLFYARDITGGTEKTLVFCIEYKKPYKLIDISLVQESLAASALLDFIERDFIERKVVKILNVAGSRASESLKIYAYVKTVISEVLQKHQRSREACKL